MSKKLKSLLIAGVVLLVLVGVMLVLLLTPKDENIDSPSSTVSTQDQSVSLVDSDYKTIETLTIENAKGAYEIVTLAEDNWGIKEFDGIPQLSTAYRSAIQSAALITANQMVEEAPSDLAKYGLEKPLAWWTVTYQDGASYVLYVGDKAPASSMRYVMLSDKKTVYLVNESTLSAVFQTKYDNIDRTMVPMPDEANQPEITEVRVDRKADEKPMILEAAEENIGKEQGMAQPFNAISPKNIPVDAEKMGKLFMPVFGLTATEVIAANPTEQALETYGLDVGQKTTLTVTTKTEVIEFYVGNSAECTHKVLEEVADDHTHTADGYYAMLKGRNVVYKVSTDSVPWINSTLDDLLSKLFYLPFIDKVEAIDMTTDEKEYHIACTGEGDEFKAVINGTAVETDNFRQFYQALIGLPAQGLNDKDVDGKPKVTIKYSLRDGTSTLIELFEQTDRRMVISVNGEQLYYTHTSEVESVVKKFEDLSQNKEINADL